MDFRDYLCIRAWVEKYGLVGLQDWELAIYYHFTHQQPTGDR